MQAFCGSCPSERSHTRFGVNAELQVLHRFGFVETDIHLVLGHRAGAYFVGCRHVERRQTFGNGHFRLHGSTGSNGARLQGLGAGHDGIVEGAGECRAVHGLRGRCEAHISRGRTVIEEHFQICDGLGSAVFSFRGGNGQTVDGFLTGEVGHLGGCTRGEVDSVEGRLLEGILGGPIEDARLLVDFTALAIASAIGVAHDHARVADQRFGAVGCADLIEVAVFGHTVEHVVLGHTEGHIGLV